MRVKFITCIYSDLYGTELGGRQCRYHHYRFSLLSLLKMANADFLCYTSDREIESLKSFFYVENKVSENKLIFEIFDLNNSKMNGLINSIKNIEETKKSDRCIEIQYSKFSWWWNEDKSYDYYYWIDAGISHCGLIHKKYLTITDEYNYRRYYECNLFNNFFLENLIKDTNDKFLIIGKENQRNHWSKTVDPKWYTDFSLDIHIIGGLFGGHRDKWDNIVNIFEKYVATVLPEDKVTPHEEQFMSLMYYNHTELFIVKQFDIWWPDKDCTPGLSDEIFETNKSFYKLLEDFNRIET